MARWNATLPTALLTAAVMLACGSGPLDVRSSYRKVAPAPSHDPLVRVDRFTVPPDRAMHALTLRATAPDPQKATDLLRADLAAVEKALADLPRCRVQVDRYDAAAPWGDAWAVDLAAGLDVDLGGTTTVTERMDRLDACRLAVLPVLPLEEEELSDERHHVATLGEAILVVDDPHAHLGALLARRAARLAAVTATAAPQLHPEDQRCVPSGAVQLGGRTLAGVVLELELACRIDADAPAPPPAG